MQEVRRSNNNWLARQLLLLATLFNFASPAWSQPATTPVETLGTDILGTTVISLPPPKAGAKSFFVTPLTETEKHIERNILRRSGPLGVAPNKIPPRDKDNKRSYVGMKTEELWKHLKDSKQLAIVGIKEPTQARGFFAGKSLVSTQMLKKAQSELLKLRGVKKPFLVKIDHTKLPVMPDKRTFPAIIIHVGSSETLQKVRDLSFVDFVEPLYPAVAYQQVAIFGCDLPIYSGSSSDGAFRVGAGAAPNLIPWNYSHHAIEQAWRLFPASSAPGHGVAFWGTDTGVFPSQRQFFEVFSPQTTSVSRKFMENNYDSDSRVRCSHGTRIAGLAAAPADASTTPNIVGVAWGSSFVSQKVGNGVLHFDTPVLGLARAIMDAASSDLLPEKNRVLLMAWGMPWESQTIRETIQSVYDANDRLIMVAAAGTGESWVVFPASMKRETVAVSIVEASNPAAKAYGLIPGVVGENVVAYGGEVDYVAVNSVLTNLALPTTGKGVNSIGQSVDSNGNLVAASSLPVSTTTEITTLGGSSSAVSIVGGSIALAWSRMPFLSRDQLMDRFVASSSCGSISGLSAGCRDGSDHRVIGAGVTDVYNAAGGARRLWIEGVMPDTPGGSIQVNVGMDGDPKIYDYLWSTGSTADTESLTLASGQALTVSLTATNRLDGSTLTANRELIGGPTSTRTLYATTTIESWASFLDGHRISSNTNFGAMLPAGCTIRGVAGQELTVGGATPGSPWGIPHETVDNGNRGFSVTRTAFGPQNLDVLVTAWHDGFSAIRVRPVYFVQQPPGVDCNTGGLTQSTP